MRSCEKPVTVSNRFDALSAGGEAPDDDAVSESGSGWETDSSGGNSSNSSNWEPTDELKAYLLARKGISFTPTEQKEIIPPKTPDPPKEDPKPITGRLQKGRWSSEVKCLAYSSNGIDLSFRIKEGHKRRICSLKRFSLKDRRNIPFGDDDVYPHRWSIDAHNARVHLFRHINKVLEDVLWFRASPVLLPHLLGLTRELRSSASSYFLGSPPSVDALRNKIGYLLRTLGGKRGFGVDDSDIGLCPRPC